MFGLEDLREQWDTERALGFQRERTGSLVVEAVEVDRFVVDFGAGFGVEMIGLQDFVWGLFEAEYFALEQLGAEIEHWFVPHFGAG